jgi:hypothetical protein
MAHNEPIYDCTVMELPEEDRLEAAFAAIQENPVNAPLNAWTPQHIAGYTTKFWKNSANLTVSFMDGPSTAFINLCLDIMNQWGQCCEVKFRWTQRDGQVRIARGQGGYYSYLGTDILRVRADSHTMNLQGFTENTSRKELLRVILHETGHTLGFIHEHTRKEIIELLRESAVIDHFRRTQGWSEREVIAQILTPPDPRSLSASAQADVRSIMAYSFAAHLTKNNVAIPGGDTLTGTDCEYANVIYPKVNGPPPQPPTGSDITIHVYNGSAVTTMTVKNADKIDVVGHKVTKL